MKTKILGMVVAAMMIAPISASAKDYQTVAHELGNVLASEEPCGLAYRAESIEAFVKKNVSDDEMGFASMLRLMTVGAGVGISEMSGSEKAAHCAQIRRVAKRYGFTD